MLTDAEIQRAKPAAKQRKLYDARGLYLLLKPNGGKYWRWKYRHGGKEKLLAFGVYPAVSLRTARARADAARAELHGAGSDPGAGRRRHKVGDSFEAVARECILSC